MAQIIDSAANFDGFDAIPASVLHPWLALGEQATLDIELHALVRAVEALSWEWCAAWYVSQALWWLGSGMESGLEGSLAQVTQALQEAGRNLRRALASWESAISWIDKHGDPHKAALYQPLYGHALAQQQRLDQSLARLQTQVVLLCQEWGLPLISVPDCSGEVGDGRNA